MQFLSFCWTFLICQYTSWSSMTLPQQEEKFGSNTYSIINHPPDIVHRSCLLPPSLFVFLVAYDFEVCSSCCFCQLKLFPFTWFRQYCLVSHHILCRVFFDSSDTFAARSSPPLLSINSMMRPIFHDPLDVFSWVWTTSPTHGSYFDCILRWRL